MKTETHNISNLSSRTPRPPVVAIMGHIDHGKSTLLAYIRKSTKALNEAGGITQHISAYEVEHKNGDGVVHKITFLDTPGHEAFSGIRTRGAQVADVAVLVVSAEDGVKPQTLEVWKSIVESKTPFVVAINKIDKPEADIERTKNNLTENGIYIEGYGGDVPVVALSAKTGEGVPELLDMILLMADMVDLTGDSRMPGEGVIIESNLDQRKGISAVCVIKNGTVRTGMYAVAGKSHTPVRILENFLGKHVDNATFSSPVNIIGWDVLPTVGSTFETFATREDARDAVLKNQVVVASHAEKFDENVVYVPLIVKADAGGSLEAVITQIEKVATDKVRAHVISRGIGMISEKDVQSAIGNTKAIVVGFNVGIDSPASGLALRNDIDIKTFDVIYKLTEWLAEKFVERTPKVHTEESTGTAKVIKMFSKVKDKQILGAKVETGQITLGSTVKIIRRDAEIGQGKVKELQEQKKRVDSVTEGKEFGTLIEAKIEIAVGDRIESFVVVEK